MEHDLGGSFPFNFDPNGIPFVPKLKGKLSLRSYPIQFERKWNTSFLSVVKSACAKTRCNYTKIFCVQQLAPDYEITTVTRKLRGFFVVIRCTTAPKSLQKK